MGSPQPQTAAPAYQQQAPVPTYPPQAAPLSTAFRVGAPATPPSLDARQVEAIAYLAEHGTAGPTELSQTCGFSAPTWSRSLSSLQEMGLAIKQGQKYRLTTMGTALA
jgi:predicted HTH transcriptional regulator